MAVHIVIMGCGRVGSTIAHILEDQGHSVAVIDQDAEAFRKLRSGFKGSKITGIGFDRDVLIEAGIERADAFAAVSSGDNSNVIAARVARESFSVQPGRGQDLRSAPGRGVPAARHPDRGHRPLDGGPDAAQDASGGLANRSGGIRPAPLVLAEVGLLATAGWARRCSRSRRRRQPGSRSSPGSARRCCRGQAPCCSRATSLHVIAQESDIKRITAVFCRPAAPGKGGH